MQCSQHGWRDLTPDLIARIASFSHPNDVAGSIKLLNRETAACLREHRRLALAAPPMAWPLHDLPQLAQQPWPGDAFMRHWGRPEPWRALNLRERRRLLCLAASSGHAASLASALAHCDCGLHVHALEGAAAAGDVTACEMLLGAGCEWAHSVFAAAAGAGHLPVCRAFWAAGLRPPPPRHTRSAVVEAACRGGHVHVLSWLADVGYVRVLLPPPLPSPPPPRPPEAAPAASLSIRPEAAARAKGEAVAEAEAEAEAGAGAERGAGAEAGCGAPSTADASRPAAPDAPLFMHGFAAVAAARSGHTALLSLLLDFGRRRCCGVRAGGRGGAAADGDGDGGAGGCGDGGGGGGGGGLLDGVTRPHRQALMTAYAYGCRTEELVAVYDAYMQREWPLVAAAAAAAAGAPGGGGGGGGGAGGGLSLSDLHLVLLQRAISSPRPDGSWADKVDFILAAWPAAAGAVAVAGGGGAGQAPAAEPRWAGLDSPWSVWEGAARHADHPEEVERRMRFLVSRGLVPGPGALKAAAAAGSVGALRFLLDECGLALAPAVGECAARSAKLEAVQLLLARCGRRVDGRQLAAALAGLRGPGALAVATTGCDHGYGDTYSSGRFNRCAAEALALLKWLLAEPMAAERAAAAAGRAGTDVDWGHDGGSEVEGACSKGPSNGQAPPHRGARRMLGGACWLSMLEEVSGAGVSEIPLLEALALSADVQREDEGEREGDGADKRRRAALVMARVAGKLLAGGSQAAVEWAACRLRERCPGLSSVPPPTTTQLWAAACGGNFAAVRAACAAGLGRMPAWLPDCAHEVTLQAGGHVGALRFFLEQPGCRGVRSWWRLWQRLRAAEADPRQRLQLTQAQADWLMRRQECQQAQEQGRERGLCGLKGVLRRVFGLRGAGRASDDAGGRETSEEDLADRSGSREHQ
ncbi:hypothetical protein HXX76_004821 [Chlamydomonas incerta]|uniref:Uncharacterized protein n=1 Tax=Chlamydomonas incerta TaxID=51695 RepID=A0A835W8B2_CHLIN|nr:hypothetical protein HXX76_004821 [Chlamydomonas incerta]|eukprot:KAG2439466.1 hypothetical protein HXX76_004821 [Chlamydomonas incerta]